MSMKGKTKSFTAPSEKAHWLTHLIFKECLKQGLLIGPTCLQAGVERRQWHRWRHGQQPNLRQVELILKKLKLRLIVTSSDLYVKENKQ